MELRMLGHRLVEAVPAVGHFPIRTNCGALKPVPMEARCSYTYERKGTWTGDMREEEREA